MLLAALLAAQLTAAVPPVVPSLVRTVVAAEAAGSAGKGVALADREPQRRKSFNLLIGVLELGVAAVAAYVGVGAGILVNVGLGAMSWPPDRNDVLLLAALPAGLAAVAGWVVGLLDLGQRSFLGSALWAVLGAVVGELGGLGLGYLLGRSLAPADFAGAASIAVLVAPVFAAFGAVLFMELLKPGELVASASLLPVRDGRGLVSLAPAVALRF